MIVALQSIMRQTKVLVLIMSLLVSLCGLVRGTNGERSMEEGA